MDVVPDVQLGPVGERKDADALALIEAAVVQVPEFGPLVLGVPLAEGVAEAVDALLGARFLFVAPRAAEGRVEVARAESVEQGARLQQAAALLSSQAERAGAVVDGLPIGVDDQPDADFRAESVAELDHLLELVSGVDVQQGKRDRAGVKGLLRQTHHHRRILADGIEHHRPLEFGSHFTQDVNALGFQGAQVAEDRVQAWEKGPGSSVIRLSFRIPNQSCLNLSGYW